MYGEISYDRLLAGELGGSYVLLDVRSEAEYADFHIPNAISLPLFTEEQRSEIGTLYDNGAQEIAKKSGIEYAAQKLPHIYERITELLKEYDYVVMYCARGGFRSSAICALLRSLKLRVQKLKGGYKAYRAYVNDNLESRVEGKRAIVLYGCTGVGKTNILNELSKRGEPVIDLERYANHRGSLLGSVGLSEPYSQKQFDSYLFDALGQLDSDYFFVEGESRKIGKVTIPQGLFDVMREGVHVNVTASMPCRIENIRRDYVVDRDEDILSALEQLRTYIRDERINDYIEHVKLRDYDYVISELITRYYDPRYENNNRNIVCEICSDDLDAAVNMLLQTAQQL